MKPDTHPGFQEVRQALAETATRHTGIRCKLRQLQSPQEGLENPVNHFDPAIDTEVAYKTAERYADPPTPKCYQHNPREP